MLSMFKGKKGFSVLFHSGEEPRHSATLSELSVCHRSSTHHSNSGCQPSRGSLEQYHCQRCSKRFSALEHESLNELASQCHRCGYPTCPQCREPVKGTPPWVCCVCKDFKSIMWLLESTRVGPMLVATIVEYCDPRGQRLMRSMFRFTLQQYQALTPRRFVTFAGDVSGSRLGSDAPSSSRPASRTPPACPSSKTRTSSRLSGERSGPRLTHVSGSLGNVRRSLIGTHPKRVSRLSSTRQSGAGAALGLDTSTAMGLEDASKENTPVIECISRGSEVLRRMEEAVGVVEYSPELNWRACSNGSAENEEPGKRSPSLTGGRACFTQPEERCTAVADIFHAKRPGVLSSDAMVGVSVVDVETSSPSARPSGPAAFQREAPQLMVATPTNAILPTAGDIAVASVSALRAPEMSSMRAISPEQPFQCGRSWSPASSCSVRSTSPAPRFPTFGQFLDDHSDFIAGDRRAPRESDLLLTVSPDTEDDEHENGVIELAHAWRSSRTLPKGDSARGELQTPRRDLQHTPLSALADGSPDSRSRRRTSGLNYCTPTRALDMSCARGTLHHGSSSCRRNTRGSLQELPAPHLYRNSTAHTGAPGKGRCSGQVYDSSTSSTSKKVSSHSSTADLGRGQRRLQQAPFTTRTAGRLHSGDSRQRPAPPRSNTATPLERTASRYNALQRMPSYNRALVHTNPTSAPLRRTISSYAHDLSFGRTNSGTPHSLTSKPSHRPLTTGIICGRARLQRTESEKFARAYSGIGMTARVAARDGSGVEGAHRGNESRVPAGASSLHMHPLTRTLSSGSPLQRTASHVCISGRVVASFGRTKSVLNFSRSATSNTGLVEAARAADVRGAAPRRHALDVFTRTATGTSFLSRSSTRQYDRNRYPLVNPPHPSPATASGSTRKAVGEGCQRPVAASPMRRVPNATRSSTPTAFSRSATGTHNFQRQGSHTRREALRGFGNTTRRTVDPAPSLGAMSRRKALGSTLRRTPSSAGAARTGSAAPCTPRQFIISSVSTAATPAPVAGGGRHSVCRPVISSGPSSPKTRSSRGSLISGRTSGASGDAGGAPVAERASLSEPLSKQAAVQRRLPLVKATTARQHASVRLATPIRCETAPSIAPTARPKARRCLSASPFAGQRSYNHICE